MPHTRRTLRLEPGAWDLVLNTDGRPCGPDPETGKIPATGSIVVAEGAYATAQNVANECRVFEGDLAFERGRGLPYYLIALGRKPSPSVLKARLRDAAMLVEDVKEVTSIEIDALDTETRVLTGEISITSVEGENAKIGI